MANQEQVKRLLDGVEGWNKWRQENPELTIDLRGANLKGIHLKSANLEKADLGGADLHGANLLGSDLMDAVLVGADLGEADLRGANFWGAELCGAHLKKANLLGADLIEAGLEQADFTEANLKDADLGEAKLNATVLGDIDLSEARGLDDVHHNGPSPISTSTLERSKGKIPEKFLRGCGLNDWEIESAKLYQPGLSETGVYDILYRIYTLRKNRVIQIHPVYISYSQKDEAFVDEMEIQLDKRGIRFWRDIHDASPGRLEKVVDLAIRQNPIVLLILSEQSVKSDWVEHEAQSARELEKELGRDVLCPVALDDAWKTCSWPERLREQIMEYNILDFSKWKDEGEFAKMFRKLIDGLDLFYKE
jgi:uncharacterized protein YjbI with pentapeptide repeats